MWFAKNKLVFFWAEVFLQLVDELSAKLRIMQEEKNLNYQTKNDETRRKAFFRFRTVILNI